MSEPSKNLDLTALSDALGEQDRQSIAQGAKTSTLQGKQSDSPVSLSPSPAPSPKPSTNQIASTANTQAVLSPTAAVNTPHPDPNVQNIKAMFPEMDLDTIQAVLVADGGNFEQAINILLQMSDPTYVPPPPFQKTSQSYEDEQLARSIAAQQEESDRQNQSFFPASRGGGLGSLFRGGNGQQSSTPSTPSYDPNQLNYQPYQPRIRRTTSGQQRVPTSQPFQESQNSSTAVPYGNALSAWPSSKDAKVWQEDINKMAGAGFAKAASTFSALRQRGEKAFAGQQQQGNSGTTNENSQSSLSNWSSRKPSTASSFASSAISPTIGSSRGFDKDPTPVDDNELAKILARGKEEGKKSSISERYKEVSSTNLRNQSKPNVETQDGDDDDEELGWDDAGRTGSKEAAPTTTPSSSVAPSFEPILISDNSMAPENTTKKSSEEKSKLRLSNTPRNAVSLMESSTGRGLTSPLRTSSKMGEDDGDDDDSNDLEYVSNPFEDED